MDKKDRGKNHCGNEFHRAPETETVALTTSSSCQLTQRFERFLKIGKLVHGIDPAEPDFSRFVDHENRRAHWRL